MYLIKQEIKALTESGVTTGIALAFGNENKAEILCSGHTDDKKTTAINKESVFDLASVTKLFLALSYFRANEYQKIDFQKELGYYCGDRFPNIKNVSLEDLFHFNCCLMTDRRITDCDYATAVEQLCNIKQKSFQEPIYSDMSSLVLGFAFADIFNTSFGEFFNKEFIEKCSLSNTFWGTDRKETNNFVNYDNEIIIRNNELISFSQKPLIVNDKKAEILSNNGQFLCGNAGLFSSAEDMIKISQALLNRELLTNNSLMQIANPINSDLPQRFGHLSYRRYPDEILSEVCSKMSDKTFAISGFTGTYLMIDPINNLFLFMGGNRLNNRVTFTDNTDLITDNNRVVFNNQSYYYTKNYVYHKDKLRNLCCDYLLNQ